MGPTPPGTGVYAEHFPSTSFRSISPHFSGWYQASMTTDLSLIQSDLMNLGMPTAPTNMSAF